MAVLEATPMHQLDFEEILLFGSFIRVRSPRFGFASAISEVLEPEPALLVGGGEMAAVLVGKLEAHPECRLEVIGVLSTAREPVLHVNQAAGAGHADDLAAVAERTTRRG